MVRTLNVSPSAQRATPVEDARTPEANNALSILNSGTGRGNATHAAVTIVPSASTRDTKVSSARKRKFAPKSRTGCVTCKLRRVKCDEARPKCDRCTKLGLACDGYTDLKTININLFLDRTDQRSFLYFREQTLPQLSSFIEFGLWDQLALRHSYSEATVLRVLVAIGAFHEYLETSNLDERQERRLTALQLYHKAVAKAASDLRHMVTADALLVTILFTFLENIKGSVLNAVKHLKAAAAILAGHQHSSPGGKSVLISTVLTPIINRLNSVLHLLYAPSSAMLRKDDTEHPYSSLLEAHDDFFSIAESITLKLDTHGNAVANHCAFLGQLDKWWERFGVYIATAGGISCGCEWPENLAHHQLGSAFLEILYRTTRARLHTALTGLETTFDLYEDSFHRILDLSTIIVQILRFSPTASSSVRDCIGFKPAHFLSCWMVAEGSRNPHIRRRAIKILKQWHWSDGHWDTYLTADAVSCIVRREESHSPIQPVTCAADIQEANRVRFLGANYFRWDTATNTPVITYRLTECDFVKISVLCRDPRSDDRTPKIMVESLWLDRRSHGLAIERTCSVPRAIGGFFPQVQRAHPTKLWAMLDESRSPLDIWQARRFKIVHPPFDRDPNRGRVVDQGRYPIMEERVMGLSFKTLLYSNE
ncbi:uncharacterized protein HMPREF1541_04118 [Cyphellophora europaea CBS 101466]|uniref:Zn(2)-C6 fungal-type domain-containing protein n=1 Tax=Cyphellophora europaea (strain CBS 101466) TaxID=1220924 RepID=W2S0G5_CYPE1|nr:uncharacterized protein HMPREF1541_04118 [Cyphellophora europaea CBS 101466]ETN42177.1 hypothetical protein HMPREF1541_04118 [Cyphellophora europaea CBS 101466]